MKGSKRHRWHDLVVRKNCKYYVNGKAAQWYFDNFGLIR
jgi:hypothetical protein